MNSEPQQNSLIRSLIPLAGAAVVAVTSAATGQVLHETDMIIRHGGDGAIESGLPASGGGVLWGERVVSGRLDTGQFTNLADDPGFDSFSGAFPTGSVIGIDLLGSLRVWDGAGFDNPELEYVMNVTKGNDVISTPPANGDLIDESRVAGFPFGTADSGGRFHHHVRFFLDPFDPFNAEDGIWTLTVELWSTNPVVLPSKPIFIVFGSGPTADADLDAAIAWVEDNLAADGGCNPADLAEPLGILDLSDINAFVSAFVGGDDLADLAEPFGILDLSDINTFVGSFVGGCP